MSKLNINMDDCLPYVEMAKGIFFGAVFLMSAAFTLETTQALFLHQDANHLAIQWNIFMQIPDALQGKYAGSRLYGIIFSWAVLTCYVIASSLKRWIDNGYAQQGLQAFCHLMMAVDGFANWQYLSGHEWYYQVGFVVVIWMTLMNFGGMSINFIKISLSGL